MSNILSLWNSVIETKRAPEVIFSSSCLKALTSSITNEVTKGDMKSSVLSEAFRQQGNQLLAKKQFPAACKSYTHSLFHSTSSLETAFAYGNRSAALFHLGHFQECLLDIDRCLKDNFPQEKRWRLLTRAADCHARLQRHFLNEALHSTEGARERGEITGQLSQLPPGEENTKVGWTRSLRPEFHRHYPSETQCTGLELDAALLEVKYVEERGFGVYCCQDVAAGAHLLLDEPFSARLQPDLFLTHCYRCFRRCNTLVPCTGCSQVGFCSEQCRLQAMQAPSTDSPISSLPCHRFECGHLGAVSQRDGNVGLLALACVADTHCETLCHSLRAILGSENSPEYCQKMRSALLLATNCTLRSKKDRQSRGRSAHLYAAMLKASGYIRGPSENHDLVVLALFLFLQSVSTNAHTTAEAILHEDGTDALESCPRRDLLQGLYPVLSLVNHACDPNVVRVGYSGSRVLLRALRPLHAGEELLDNYSAHYALQTRTERCGELKKQYLFQCACVACRDDWPLFSHLQQVDAFQWNNSVTPDAMDEVHQKLQQAHSEFETVLREGGEDRTECLLRVLVESSELLHKHVVKPHKEFDFVAEALKWLFQLQGSRSSL